MRDVLAADALSQDVCSQMRPGPQEFKERETRPLVAEGFDRVCSASRTWRGTAGMTRSVGSRGVSIRAMAIG